MRSEWGAERPVYVAREKLTDANGRTLYKKGERVADGDSLLAGWISASKVEEQTTPPESLFLDQSRYYAPPPHESSDFATYAPLPTGTPTVGQVPTVTTADPLALGWGDAGASDAVTSATITTITQITQDDYDALSSKDSATMYVIVG